MGKITKIILSIIFFELIIISFIALRFLSPAHPTESPPKITKIERGQKTEKMLFPDYLGITENIGLDCYSSDVWDFMHYLVKEDQCKLFERFDETTLITDLNNYITAPITDEKYEIEILDFELVSPWSIDFLPDDTILIMERRGYLVILNKTNDGIKKREINLNYGNGKTFFGLAVDPDFNTNRYIYVYNYDHDKNENQLTRFKLSDNFIIIEEKIILDGIKQGEYRREGTTTPGYHHGGRIRFGPDGKLYITTGDSDPYSMRAQDNENLNGSILRINKDGTVPKDNPFGNEIYSYGHRNPQGIDWHPKTGELYATEHGQGRMDEINKIKKGGNYGWPFWECDKRGIYHQKLWGEVWPQEEWRQQGAALTAQDVEFPIFCFYNERYEDESNYYTVAPSGGSFVTDSNHPWYGNFFFGALRGGHLQRLIFDDRKEVEKNEIFLLGFGRIRDVVFNEKDGSLYVLTGNTHKAFPGVRDKLLKLTPLE